MHLIITHSTQTVTAPHTPHVQWQQHQHTHTNIVSDSRVLRLIPDCHLYLTEGSTTGYPLPPPPRSITHRLKHSKKLPTHQDPCTVTMTSCKYSRRELLQLQTSSTVHVCITLQSVTVSLWGVFTNMPFKLTFHIIHSGLFSAGVSHNNHTSGCFQADWAYFMMRTQKPASGKYKSKRYRYRFTQYVCLYQGHTRTIESSTNYTHRAQSLWPHWGSK